MSRKHQLQRYPIILPHFERSHQINSQPTNPKKINNVRFSTLRPKTHRNKNSGRFRRNSGKKNQNRLPATNNAISTENGELTNGRTEQLAAKESYRPRPQPFFAVDDERGASKILARRRPPSPVPARRKHFAQSERKATMPTRPWLLPTRQPRQR